MRKTDYLAYIAASALAALFINACTPRSTEPEKPEGGPVKVQSVTLSRSEVTLTEGEELTLTAEVKPSDAEDKTISWSSSAPEVASVDGGKVKALKEGSATITATSKDGDHKAYCRITVEKLIISVTSLSLSPTEITLEVGETAELSASVLPENASDKRVGWISSHPAVATVSEGKVTAVSVGTSTVTATSMSGSKKATCSVTVVPKTYPVTGVSLDKASAEMIVGEDITLVASVSPENADNPSVRWSSSAPSVASVEGGKVIACGVGSSMITVTTEDGGFSASCSVSVTIPDSVILYTTSDGSPIVSNFAGIVKNEYSNGWGRLYFASAVTEIPEMGFMACSKLVSVALPPTVTSFGRSAFTDCSSLEEIALPDGLTSIEAGCFSGCTSLKRFTGKMAEEDGRSIVIAGEFIALAPSGLTEYTVPQSVTSIGRAAFAGCSSLTSITLPSGLISLGNGSFSDCSSLRSIIIPSGVDRLPYGAFSGCSRLASISLPDGLIAIDRYAFSHCRSLSTISLPEGLHTLAAYAFTGCTGLRSVSFGSAIESIGSYAFENCDTLDEVTLKATTPPSLGSSAFKGTPGFCRIMVPSASLEAYKAAWPAYASRIQEL